jgi:rRNA-processing protein FCF1
MMPVEADVRVFEELDRLLADDAVDVAGTDDPAHTRTPDRTVGPGKTSDAETDDDDSAFAVPRAVVAELERLAEGAGEAATAASVGLDLARERCRVLDHEAESGDAAVFECGTRPDVSHVVTNDGALREDLLDAGVPVISLRASNKLAVTQP